MTNSIDGNNSVGSLLEPLLKKVTPVVGSRMLWVPHAAMNFFHLFQEKQKNKKKTKKNKAYRRGFWL
jgi:hypothetical protein